MARTAPFPERTAAIRQALISRKITTMRRVALLAIALATATPALANPGDAANPDERYLRQFAASCPANLKSAAGACVPACPGGYEDTERVCIFRNEASTR
jgi:hypothetical protein